MYLKVAAYACLWYATSSVESMTQKAFYLKYPYPITVSLSHMVFNVIMLYLLLKLLGISTHIVKEKSVVVLGSLKIAASIFSHMSNLMLSVLYAQTIKTLAPILTILLSRVYYNEKQSSYVYIAVLLMSLGVTIATVTELELNVFGILAAVLMTGSSQCSMFFSKFFSTKLNMDPLTMLYNIHVVGLIGVLPIWFLVELPSISYHCTVMEEGEYSVFFRYLLFFGILSFTSHVTKFSLLKIVTSVSYAIIDSGNCIVKVVVTAVKNSNLHSPSNVFGSSLAIFGVMLYSQTKLKNKVH